MGEPFRDLDIIRDFLLPKGIVYVETGFTNVAEHEGIQLDEYFYIDASVGHSTIFSHIGLDILMLRKGFLPLRPINMTVRVYEKR